MLLKKCFLLTFVYFLFFSLNTSNSNNNYPCKNEQRAEKAKLGREKQLKKWHKQLKIHVKEYHVIECYFFNIFLLFLFNFKLLYLKFFFF